MSSYDGATKPFPETPEDEGRQGVSKGCFHEKRLRAGLETPQTRDCSGLIDMNKLPNQCFQASRVVSKLGNTVQGSFRGSSSLPGLRVSVSFPCLEVTELRAWPTSTGAASGPILAAAADMPFNRSVTEGGQAIVGQVQTGEKKKGAITPCSVRHAAVRRRGEEIPVRRRRYAGSAAAECTAGPPRAGRSFTVDTRKPR
jgi:hypothetical protein